LFYLDPPYYGTEKYYQVQFSEEDHIRLKNCINQADGSFIISYNDCEFVRNLYEGYLFEEVERNNNLNARYMDTKNKYCELIIKK